MNLIPKVYDIDNFFDSFFDSSNNNLMKSDIYEQDGDWHILIDIPGFNKDDINVEVKNGYLTISAESSKEINDEGKNYMRRERSYGKYQRSFYVGDVAEEDIKAKFKDGTLAIEVPKKEATENKKIIEIEG